MFFPAVVSIPLQKQIIQTFELSTKSTKLNSNEIQYEEIQYKS